jgi:ketosteroid isomerase-like protein
MRSANQEDASLFVGGEQNERDRYQDEPEEFYAEPPATAVVATGSTDAAPVEEVVVGKKDKKTRSSPSPGLFEDEDASWS